MEKEIGRVSHYFSHLNVAAIELSDTISVGDRVHFSGHTTDFSQTVESMQIGHRSVAKAEPGDDVAIEVLGHVREHDTLFKEI